jgi:hypothetical protein
MPRQRSGARPTPTARAAPTRPTATAAAPTTQRPATTAAAPPPAAAAPVSQGPGLFGQMASTAAYVSFTPLSLSENSLHSSIMERRGKITA